ncbi:patatin-like phospholipase family protein [Marinobacterium arenosum]|uniref:patatin-like phospholipase family protein n=1 Tax=Marinobacterium arenosum TaxID=2862496 RepID=UPI001C97789D|nr:patatin-like phospholipase family protein [Marinobacterium arenosum]MBY4678708.1 patatin-like phospholipase family protein [Marinobacterium arenosum]
MATTVSLVLGSGGARGYAHIGVIEELIRRGYQIISVAGCSMGALVGGIYAAGALNDYRDWVCGLRWIDVVRLLDVTFSKGAIRGDKVFAKLEQLVGDPLIESLPIKYTAVATDITYQKEVWFQHGSLLRAMRASVAIPGFFTPVVHGEHVLVDGGVLNPLPIIPTVAAQADLIIGVDLNASQHPVTGTELPSNIYLDRSGFTDDWPAPGSEAEKQMMGSGRRPMGSRLEGRLDILLSSVEVMQSSLTQYKVAGYPPDLIIPVDKAICSFFEFHRAVEVIEAGRLAARVSLSRLERGTMPRSVT